MGGKEGCEDWGALKAEPPSRWGFPYLMIAPPPPEVGPPGRRCAGNFCFGRRLGQGGHGKQIWGGGSTRGALLPEGRWGKEDAARAPGTFRGGDAAGEGQGASTPDPAWAGGVQDPHPVLCGVWGRLGGTGTAAVGSGGAAFRGSHPRAGLSSLFVVRCSACWRGAGQIHFIKPMGRSRYGREPVRSRAPYPPRLMPANSRCCLPAPHPARPRTFAAPGLSSLPRGGCCTAVRFNYNTNTPSSDTAPNSQGSPRASQRRSALFSALEGGGGKGTEKKKCNGVPSITPK